MKTILFIAVAILLLITVPLVAQQRYITFTDSNEVEQRHKLVSGDTAVAIRQPDGSAEASIIYKDGALTVAKTHRPDGSIEAGIGYRDGALDVVATLRPDGSAEAGIAYKDGALCAEKQIVFRNGYPICQ